MKPCIIVDVDGTLANCDWRTHHYEGMENPDWDLIASLGRFDMVYPYIMQIVQSFKSEGIAVVLLTARHEKARPETMEFIKRWGIPFDELMMRADDDVRPDAEMKADHVERMMINGFHPLFALEDNPNVVKMLLMHNIPVLQHKSPGEDVD